MVAVQTDPSQNLLIIRYAGYVGLDEAKRCLEDVRLALPEVQSGFRILADLTDLESMDVGCVPYLTKIMDICNASGVAAVVRIIPDPKRDIGLQIMSLFHYGGGVKIITCQTADDAMKALQAPPM